MFRPIYIKAIQSKISAWGRNIGNFSFSLALSYCSQRSTVRIHTLAVVGTSQPVIIEQSFAPDLLH